jgi:hypothetical protein
MRVHIYEAWGNGTVTGINDPICMRERFVFFQHSSNLVVFDQDMAYEWPISETINYFSMP